jgi:hypothetical protein
MLLLAICFVSFAVAFAETQAPSVEKDAIKLSTDDQKQLDLIAGQLEQLKPQLEAARKQQHEAQINLASANAFIAEYDKTEAIKEAFRFRIAADVCRCDTKELTFTKDGRGLVRKSNTKSKEE